MGTPIFASYSLEQLHKSGANIVAVITAPDRPAGRGRKLNSSNVKQTALDLNIPILQPVNLKDPDFLKDLKALNADLQIVVAFRMLPEEVWAMPTKGTFNVHASLLPQYRGAAPINWAIINGETMTGVSTFFLDHKIDTGHIVLQKSLSIHKEDTAGSLHDKLMELGASAMLETVNLIANDKVKLIPQTKLSLDKELKSAPKIFKADCRINWEKSIMQVHNKIRGLSPYPGSFTEMISPNNEAISLKIYKSKTLITNDLSPGETKSDGKTFIHVGTLNGDLELCEIQLAGKKRMKTSDFLKGFKWEKGIHFK